MQKVKERAYFICLAASAIILSLVSCRDPISASGGGSLRISVAEGQGRLISPGINMTAASYLIEGKGPGTASFSTTITGSAAATIDSLVYGDWLVTVTAYNAGGVAIGGGTGTATITVSQVTSLPITVYSYVGLGTLTLGLNWSLASVALPTVEASLLPPSGSPRALAFSVNAGAGTASFSASDVATGYQTLTVLLKDNGALVMGAVDVVRIAKDQTTAGDFSFDTINKPLGAVSVSITGDMGDPLTVSISGAASTKTLVQSLALGASIAETGVIENFVWYVNGVFQGTGSGFTFGSSWLAGSYRITVTAFSADGSRAGSASTLITVTP